MIVDEYDRETADDVLSSDFPIVLLSAVHVLAWLASQLAGSVKERPSIRS
jgi:hypothetical protein